jgi:hypothetical protein
MTAEWYKRQPKNRNFLAPVGFQLQLEIFPGVDFFCQKVNLPGINMPFTEVPTRFRTYPIVPGGGVTYDDFVVSFIIDEDLSNYNSIEKWIRKYGSADENDGDLNPEYSRGQLFIVTSNFNPAFVIDFENLFPINLNAIDFDATVDDIEYFTAQVTFKFTNFTLRDKNFKLL